MEHRLVRKIYFNNCVEKLTVKCDAHLFWDCCKNVSTFWLKKHLLIAFISDERARLYFIFQTSINAKWCVLFFIPNFMPYNSYMCCMQSAYITKSKVWTVWIVVWFYFFGINNIQRSQMPLSLYIIFYGLCWSCARVSRCAYSIF